MSLLAFNLAVAGSTGVGRKVSRHKLQVINKRRVEESRAYLSLTICVLYLQFFEKGLQTRLTYVSEGRRLS